jgi:ribosome-binding factor A
MLPNRIDRVAKELQRILGDILLHEISDPRLGFVTITKVVPAQDLMTAKVYISVIGNDAQKKISLDVLTKAHGYIQCLIGKKMQLRNTPKIFFRYDNSLEGQVQMSKLIDDVVQENKDPETQDESNDD